MLGKKENSFAYWPRKRSPIWNVRWHGDENGQSQEYILIGMPSPTEEEFSVRQLLAKWLSPPTPFPPPSVFPAIFGIVHSLCALCLIFRTGGKYTCIWSVCSRMAMPMAIAKHRMRGITGWESEHWVLCWSASSAKLSWPSVLTKLARCNWLQQAPRHLAHLN